MSAPGFRDLVGLRVDPPGDGNGEGRARTILEAGPDHLNPHGTVHGGVLATLADVAMGEAAALEGNLGVTIEMKVTYLSPGEPGEIAADARVIKRGQRITIVEVELTQGEDMIAHGIGTFATPSPNG